jgi:DNA-binding XRE family transcriptional regulator
MSNIAAVLKQEIVRLARREVRGELRATKKTTVVLRHSVASMKRHIVELEREIVLLRRQSRSAPVASAAPPDQKLRFVAKGLKSLRTRLGVSGNQFAKLVGVSVNSVYNWEQGHTIPRPEQLSKIAGLRSIGKQEAHARLRK